MKILVACREELSSEARARPASRNVAAMTRRRRGKSDLTSIAARFAIPPDVCRSSVCVCARVCTREIRKLRASVFEILSFAW